MLTQVHVFNKYFLFFWVVTTFNRLKDTLIQKRIFYNYRLMWHGFQFQIFLYPYAFWYSPICQFVLQFGKAIHQNIKSTSTYVTIRYVHKYNIFVLKYLPYVINIVSNIYLIIRPLTNTFLKYFNTNTQYFQKKYWFANTSILLKFKKYWKYQYQ